MEINGIDKNLKIPSVNHASRLRAAARQLETSFLTEMLKSAGLGKSRESHGVGVGEDQFSSFLVEAQAAEMVRAGGIGLAEALFDSLKDRNNEKP